MSTLTHLVHQTRPCATLHAHRLLNSDLAQVCFATLLLLGSVPDSAWNHTPESPNLNLHSSGCFFIFAALSDVSSQLSPPGRCLLSLDRRVVSRHAPFLPPIMSRQSEACTCWGHEPAYPAVTATVERQDGLWIRRKPAASRCTQHQRTFFSQDTTMRDQVSRQVQTEMRKRLPKGGSQLHTS